MIKRLGSDIYRYAKDPRHIFHTYFVVYFLFLVNGGIVILATNRHGELHEEFGLSFYLGVMLCLGGVVALCGLIRREWFAERSGIFFIFGGLLGEMVAITTESWPMTDKIYYFSYALIMFLLLNIRRVRIKGLTLDPSEGGRRWGRKLSRR